MLDSKRVDENIKFYPSWNKTKLSDLLFAVLSSVKESRTKPVRNKHFRIKNPQQLKKLASNALGKTPKETLVIALCNDKWESVYREWKEGTPVTLDDAISNSKSSHWFSRPTVDNTGNVKFHLTDACHILTCLRTKICTPVIEGLCKSAWEKAAESSDTQLNMAIVIECIDKQSVAFAHRLFAKDVEKFMRNNGLRKEAEFVYLIRRRFEAEDEPGISAVERCERRKELRQYLLDGVNFSSFPPKTHYVKGIPVVTYEALLVNIERKIQIYEFLPNHCYNTRALATQEVEQFFSAMRDLDPSGLGTPKPDDIPEMIATAAWLDNIRMNPERDHFFDSKFRIRVKSQRKSGDVNIPHLPARGQRGVRQYHARDESKILAHYRRGLANF